MDQPAHTADVRMRGFRQRSTVEAALGWLVGQLKSLPQRPTEPVPLAEAAGRVLAQGIDAGVDVPGFDRAMMDGYAVRAAETHGATPYHPLPLRLVGESLPGRPLPGTVGPGQAARIMTGAPMPQGADAVLPAEYVTQAHGHRPDPQAHGHRPVGRAEWIHALAPVTPGKHVGRRGEDVAGGDRLLDAGRVLRPQDVGVLASIGREQIPVLRRPRVRIVVTGDELLPAGSEPQPHRLIDSNGPMLDALIARDGGVPLRAGITPDRPRLILEAMTSPGDAVIVSGGSSVGQEDHAPRLLAEHGELAVHGIAMRPSSPTGLGTLPGHGGPRLAFLLPGNPVSCLSAYDFFAGRAVRRLGGRPADWPYRTSRLPLTRKAVSAVGRLDYLRVTVTDRGVEPLAVGGASVLSSTVRADGFVLIPPDSEGYPPGTEVEVFFYQ